MHKLKKETQYIIAVAALLAVGIGAAAIYDRQEPQPFQDDQETPESSETDTLGEPNQSSTSPSPGSTTPKKKKDTPFTYQEAVEQYEDYRIQLDSECNATPAKVTFKNHTKVMFDNRAPQQRIISLDGRGYKIGPYGFIFLELSSATLPHTISVGCDQKYNVAQIFLQS